MKHSTTGLIYHLHNPALSQMKTLPLGVSKTNTYTKDTTDQTITTQPIGRIKFTTFAVPY